MPVRLTLVLADGTDILVEFGCGDSGEIEIPEDNPVVESWGSSKAWLLGDWYTQLQTNPGSRFTIDAAGTTLTIVG